MGTWSTSISGNDEYMSVYDRFRELYGACEGKEWKYTESEIKQKMEEEFATIRNEKDTSSDYWFALARVYWEYGIADDTPITRTKEIIESGTDLDRWKTLGGTGKQIRERKKALDAFLYKLSTPNSKPTRRPKLIKVQPPFRAGDLLVIEDKDGYFAAGIVSGESADKWGRNVVHLLNYYSKEKPSAAELLELPLMVHEKKPEAYVCEAWGNMAGTNIFGLLLTAKGFNKAKCKVEKVGSINWDSDAYISFGVKSFGDFSKYGWEILSDYARLNFRERKADEHSALLYFLTDRLAFTDADYQRVLSSLKEGKPFELFSGSFDPGRFFGRISTSSLSSGIWARIAIRDYAEMNPYLVTNVIKRLLARWLREMNLVLDDYWFKIEEFSTDDEGHALYKRLGDEILEFEQNNPKNTGGDNG